MVLYLTKLANGLMLTSTLIYTLCVQFRLRAMHAIMPYTFFYSSLLIVFSLGFYTVCITASFFFGYRVAGLLTFVWFLYILIVEQVTCFLFFYYLNQVSPIYYNSMGIFNTLFMNSFVKKFSNRPKDPHKSRFKTAIAQDSLVHIQE
jgi:hypothetical protein